MYLSVLVFALLLCCGVAIGIGVFTALRATAGEVRKGLTEGSREQASSQSSQRVGRAIVAAQIAITLVLVIGAGLLGRSLMKVLEVNPGFRVEKIVTMDVSLPRPEWTDWKAKAGQAIFFHNLIERLGHIPGVRQVGATSDLPMTGRVANGQFLLMTQNELPKNPTNLQELSRDFDILFRQKRDSGKRIFASQLTDIFRLSEFLSFADESLTSATAPTPRTLQSSVHPSLGSAGPERIPSATPLNSEIWMATSGC